MDNKKFLNEYFEIYRKLAFNESCYEQIEAFAKLAENVRDNGKKLLFAGNGAGGGFAALGIDNTFQTMNNYEFLSDQFVNVFLEHNFGHILYKYKYSLPELLIFQNIGYGSLQYKEPHVNVNS